MMTVVPADAQRWGEGLSLLFSQSSPYDREQRVSEALESAASGELDLGGLLIAEDQGRAVAAGLFALQADTTAFVWPVGVCSQVRNPDAAADAVLQEIGRRLDEAGAWLGQCLLEPEARADRAALVRNGFEHLADLVFLMRPLDGPLPPEPAGSQTIVFDPQANAERFAQVLEQTYAGTLDCPQLGGLRTGAEALAGHRLTGRFSPERWKIYRVDGCDAGVLLLTDHPGENVWEVVYMGVVPGQRGRGLGRTMLLAGLHEAQAAGRGAVSLAVDARNHYAKKIYYDTGFVDVGVRSVHIRVPAEAAGW